MNEIVFYQFDKNHCCETDYLEKVVQRLDELIDGFSIVVTPSFQDLPGSTLPYLVILTSDELHNMPDDPFLGHNVRAIFRQCNDKWTCDMVKTFPIPLGYNCRSNTPGGEFSTFYPATPLHERPFDVFFAGQKSPPRKQMFKAVKCLDKSISRRILGTAGFRMGLSVDQYLRELGNSKIALVPDGTEVESFRYIEAFASGCVVITTTRDPLWYYEGSPAVFIEDWSKLTSELIRSILARPDDGLRSQGLSYYDRMLGPGAIAKYISEVLVEVPSTDNLVQLVKSKSALARRAHREAKLLDGNLANSIAKKIKRLLRRS